MASANPELSEVMTQPRVEAFEQFFTEHGIRYGKFVRMGGFVTVAPLMKYGQYGKTLTHINLFWSAIQHPDSAIAGHARAGAKEAAELQLPEPLEREDISDAGAFTCKFVESNLASLIIDGYSYDLGRADDNVRKQTAATIQGYLLPRTDVVVEYFPAR